MDASSQNIPLPVVVFIALFGLVTFFVYGWIASRVASRGGKVSVDKFGIPDLLVGGLLASYLLVFIVIGFESPTREIHNSDLVANASVELMLVAGLCSFMHFRGFNLPAQLGLRAVKLYKIPPLGFLLLLAFYPLLICSGVLTQKIPGAKQQELIKFFMEASHEMNYRTLIYMFITGTVVAPIAEEFIFRGYFYPVLKRYLGMTAGILLNAALFAAVHVNVTALPVLFLFAICLTLIYEFTGSILVNMCVHSFFNLCALALAFYESTSSSQ